MSKKTDNLNRIIQDLEARYGKDDSHVRQLYVELNALKVKEDARCQTWKKLKLRSARLCLSDVAGRALNA